MLTSIVQSLSGRGMGKNNKKQGCGPPLPAFAEESKNRRSLIDHEASRYCKGYLICLAKESLLSIDDLVNRASAEFAEVPLPESSELRME